MSVPDPNATLSWRTIARRALWTDNAALVQLLGLCPLLAVTGSVVNGLGLGIATIGVMVGSSLSVSLVRRWIPVEVRLPAFVMVIAAFTTIATLLMQAYAFALYQVIALFVQIIVTNCAILGRVETFASRQPVVPAVADALLTGLGFAAVLVVLGGLRELIGHGTLFAGMELLFGPAAAGWRVEVLPGYPGFLLAVLPPGAFLTTGLLIAAHRALRERQRRYASSGPRPPRVRPVLTGRPGGGGTAADGAEPTPGRRGEAPRDG